MNLEVPLTATTEEEVVLLDENSDSKDGSGGNWIDQAFSWKEYLTQNNDKPASERLFKHVSEI